MNNRIKNYLFSTEMRDFIGNVERMFNYICQVEGTNMTMEDWINGNIEALEKEGVLKGLTDREKFLFVLSILSCSIRGSFGE
ncbi:hypothetical protein [Clostridium senegalense]|uniref:hypothetical protein n=1 Tax=Clostridium senegalense TaxID=1465809 RepID=UPI0002885348|nr:hypothetical protein [Clostridium senegalense]